MTGRTAAAGQYEPDDRADGLRPPSVPAAGDAREDTISEPLPILVKALVCSLNRLRGGSQPLREGLLEAEMKSGLLDTTGFTGQVRTALKLMQKSPDMAMVKCRKTLESALVDRVRKVRRERQWGGRRCSYHGPRGGAVYSQKIRSPGVGYLRARKSR